jgi:hypothetical protein
MSAVILRPSEYPHLVVAVAPRKPIMSMQPTITYLPALWPPRKQASITLPCCLGPPYTLPPPTPHLPTCQEHSDQVVNAESLQEWPHRQL